MGRTPESVLGELAKPDEVSADSIARLLAFAAWQNGDASIVYDDLLDRVTMQVAQSATIEVDPAEDDSPEA